MLLSATLVQFLNYIMNANAKIPKGPFNAKCFAELKS
jgi:hypothetical protein